MTGKLKGAHEAGYTVGKWLYFRPVQVVRDIGTGAAREIADLIYKEERHEHRSAAGSQPDLIQRRMKFEGTFGQRLGKTLEKVSNKDGEAIVQGLNSPRGTVPRHLEAHAREARKLLDDLQAYQDRAGLKIGYEKNHFPRVYDLDKLLKPVGHKRFVALMDAHGYGVSRQLSCPV